MYNNTILPTYLEALKLITRGTMKWALLTALLLFISSAFSQVRIRNASNNKFLLHQIGHYLNFSKKKGVMVFPEKLVRDLYAWRQANKAKAIFHPYKWHPKSTQLDIGYKLYAFQQLRGVDSSITEQQKGQLYFLKKDETTVVEPDMMSTEISLSSNKKKKFHLSALIRFEGQIKGILNNYLMEFGEQFVLPEGNVNYSERKPPYVGVGVMVYF